MNHRVLAWVPTVLSLAGCAESVMPAWIDASADTCSTHAPTTNVCAAEGCNLGPLTLPGCNADGETFSFYDQDHCPRELTLIVIEAGWSMPCMRQAPMVEQQITANPAYAGRVRVVTVVFQNPDYTVPTAAFCRTWQLRYGLTSQMAIDPEGATQQYAPGLAFPATILIDRHGQIVYRVYGEDMPGLIRAIDAHLH
jgi:hypothetical protein